MKNHKLQSFGIKNPLYNDKRNERIHKSLNSTRLIKMSKKSKVDYEVSTPIEYKDKNDEKKTFYQRIGSAFKNEKGITVKLNALPLNDTILLFKPKDEDD